MDKIELRAAADRLMYENSHNTADYNMLIEYIDHSEAIKPDKDWSPIRTGFLSRIDCLMVKNDTWIEML